MSSFILPGANRGLSESQIKVLVGHNGEFDRKIHSDPKYELAIGETWKSRLLQNPTLFNGPKFRLHSHTFANNDSNDADTPLLTLEIGLTCYKDYLGTNCAIEYAPSLRSDGIKNFASSQAYLSDAIGVGGLLKTLDGKFVLMLRSHLVSEAQGLIDRPGGHAEPEKIPGFTPATGLKNVKPGDVLAELFNSIVDEIEDEIGVKASSITENTLMGFSLNNENGGRQVFEFLLKCNINSKEILSNYATGGHKEAEESTALYCWTEDELLTSVKKPEVAAGLSIALKGAIEFYKQCVGAK